MSSADVYGRLLAAPTIERGVETCLRYFLGSYLGEVLEQNGHGREDLADPSDLVRVSEFGWPTETDVALVVVATPGTTGDARREAEAYTATWDIRAAVLADLGDRLSSREASQFYAAAAGAALTHQGIAEVGDDLRTWVRDVDGELVILEGSSVRWVGERYRQLAERDGRALIAGEALVTVTVEGARSTYGGPLEPPPDPTGEPSDRDPAVSPESASVTPSLTIERDPVEEL